jgi:hypothetical protein
MLVANESNWRTDDLTALVEAVQEMPEFKEGNHIYNSTLLLFKTSRKKASKDRYSGEVISEPKAADYDRYPSAFDDTVVVMIRSAKKLKMEVLDRLAHIAGECEQDMNHKDVVRVARCIGLAIGGYDAHNWDFSWARTKTLRTRTKVTRSREATSRRVRALESKRYDIERAARRKTQQIDDEIRRLEGLKH